MVRKRKSKSLLSRVAADDEADLCRKLTKRFNKKGFQFKFIRSYVDLEDAINHVLIEVKYKKAKDGAFQLLYGIVQQEKEDVQFIGLADRTWLTLYKCPEYGLIKDFVSNEIVDILNGSPSDWSGKKVEEAVEFLEKHVKDSRQHVLHKDLTLRDLKNAETWLDKNNVVQVYQIFSKYNISMSDFIAAQGDLEILDIEIFDNRIDIQRKDKTVSIDIKGPVDIFDKLIIQKMRIKDAEHLEDLRHALDQFRKNRPNHGAYYTEKELSVVCGNRCIELIDPDWLGEPFAGAGSLLIPFVNDGYITGWVNDYDKKTANILKADYGQYGFVVTDRDIIELSVDEIVKLVGNAKRPLFITNPPFSSSHGAAGKINYGDLGDKYGRGNQIYPTIGKIIEVIKKLGCGYLAFFSPFGVFCERKAHMKILSGLLDNFEFISGSVWSGKYFNDVSGKKPIAFTIWKYDGKTDLEQIKFNIEDGNSIGFKRCMLLKDGWKYDTRKCITGEIVVQCNAKFNDTVPKIFHSTVKKGGSELIKMNIKIDFNIDNISSEMIYGLWSITVGLRSIVGHPLVFDNAYTHMPDFSKGESLEILAYSLLYVFIGGIDYTNGLIGFVGSKKKLKFGNSKRLNDGAKYLFETYSDLIVGNQTIKEVLDDIRDDIKKDNWRADIKKEISERLDKIGYWDYIPLPLIKMKSKKLNHI